MVNNYISGFHIKTITYQRPNVSVGFGNLCLQKDNQAHMEKYTYLWRPFIWDSGIMYVIVSIGNR